MEQINKKFTKCPACGSSNRFLEHLANELKEAGFAREDWKFCYESRQGVVLDKAREATIPVGSEVPNFAISTDVCEDCGCMYAVEIMSQPVKKSIMPNIQLPPGGSAQKPRFQPN